jgi:hypothetical protein
MRKLKILVLVSVFGFAVGCLVNQAMAVVDIAQYYGLNYGHGVTGNQVSCYKCHKNPHLIQGAHTPPGNDATVGSIKGSTGVEPNSWPALGNPTPGTETSEAGKEPAVNNYIAMDPITKEYQVCFKCHANYTGNSSWPINTTNDPRQLANIAAQFNPNQYSHHPVTGTGNWKNATIRANYSTHLKPPYNSTLDTRLYCSDCHGDGTPGAPKGAHGSNTKYMLSAWGSPSNPSAANCYDNLCLICHIDDYNGGGQNLQSPWSHGSNAAHQYEGEATGDNKLGCLACHGGPANFAILPFTDDTTITANGGRSTAMHGEHFYWLNPDGSTTNPADHFLTGGYLTGITLDEYNGGNPNEGYCWAGMAGATDGCSSMARGKSW